MCRSLTWRVKQQLLWQGTWHPLSFVRATLLLRVSCKWCMSMVQYLHPVFHMADQTLSGDGVAPNDVFSAGLSLTNADFGIAMDEARSTYSQNIGAPKIPNVSWDDVGGLADVKADILDTVQLPLEYPELFASNLKKRSGTLVPAFLTVTLHLIFGLTRTHTQASCYMARQARARRSSQRQSRLHARSTFSPSKVPNS
jgi:hypothetical protein